MYSGNGISLLTSVENFTMQMQIVLLYNFCWWISKTIFLESVGSSGEIILKNLEIHLCMFCVHAYRGGRMSAVRKCTCS